MYKAIWKLTGEWLYFLGNVLVGVKVVFLLYCPLVLSLLKHRSVWVFLNKKNRIPNRGSPLNSSIDNQSLLAEYCKKWSLFVIWVLFKLFVKMRRETNFGNTIAEIQRKSRREEREMMWWMWERKKWISIMILPKKKNCGNWIAEIGGLKKEKEKKKTELWQE